jgi:hypothetical protein
MVAALLAVADAVDRTGPIIGDEDRSVLVEDDVVRTAEEVLVALDPAVGKDLLLGILAVGIGGDADDASALILMPSGATCAPRLSTGGVNSEHW